MPYADLLTFFHTLADTADVITTQHFRGALHVDSKQAQFDPVTIADRGAEQAMRALIAEKYPKHGIIGEEFGTMNENSDYTWVLDPIDGTRNYIAGIPTWGTLIGLLHMGKPFMGMMSQGFTSERWWGDGATAFYARGKTTTQRLHVREHVMLKEAIVATTSPDVFANTHDLAAFNRLKTHARSARYGNDCYNYISLCMGHTDAVVESGLKIYDIVPLIPIIEGAGGVVTNWHGHAAGDGQIIACASPELLNEIVGVITSS